MIFEPLHSGSAGNLYRVSDDQSSILIEAGLPLKAIKRALGFKLSSISAALISHSHADHSCAVRDLAAAGIDCYMSRETADAIGATGHRIHMVEPLQQFELPNGWQAMGFATQHDAPGSMGFLVSNGADKLLFATDTFYVRYRFSGLTLIAVECNYSAETLCPDLDPERKKRLYKSHFSLANVKIFLDANDLDEVKEIHLIHLSRDNADPAYFKKEIERHTGKPVFAAQ